VSEREARQPASLKELRDQLSNLFAQIRNEEVDLQVAKQLNATASSIISTVKCEIEYCRLTNEIPEIPFARKAR
jgi:hypothetical protein